MVQPIRVPKTGRDDRQNLGLASSRGRLHRLDPERAAWAGLEKPLALGAGYGNLLNRRRSVRVTLSTGTTFGT